MRKTTAPEPEAPPQDFMEAHRPRHQAFEALRTLIAAPPADAAKSFAEYIGAFSSTADTTRTRPTNLLDLYMPDLRELYTDSLQRPEVYDEHQHSQISQLMSGVPHSITDAQKNDLLLAYMRRSISKEEREARLRAQAKKQTDDDDNVIMEDGGTLADTMREEQERGVFEKQNFGDKIIV